MQLSLQMPNRCQEVLQACHALEYEIQVLYRENALLQVENTSLA